MPRELRARSVAPTTGRFLFSLVAPQTDGEASRSAARAATRRSGSPPVRYLGGRLLSLEADPVKCEAWRRNVADAGLEDWADLLGGDARETLLAIDDVFDVVFLDAEKEDYEEAVRARADEAEPAALVVADNVLSHEETLGRIRARVRRTVPPQRHGPARPRAGAHDDPALTTPCATVPVYHGKEVVLVELSSTGSGGTSG